MGNRPAPERRMLTDLAQIRQNYWEKAIADQTIDPGERRGLRVIDNLISFVTETKARRKFAAAIVKGVETDAYLNELAEPFRIRITNLDDERSARNVVRFPEPKQG